MRKYKRNPDIFFILNVGQVIAFENYVSGLHLKRPISIFLFFVLSILNILSIVWFFSFY